MWGVGRRGIEVDRGEERERKIVDGFEEISKVLGKKRGKRLVQTGSRLQMPLFKYEIELGGASQSKSTSRCRCMCSSGSGYGDEDGDKKKIVSGPRPTRYRPYLPKSELDPI